MADITHVPTRSGALYLAIVLRAAIVAVASTRLGSDPTVDIWDGAPGDFVGILGDLNGNGSTDVLVVDAPEDPASDQGSQYTSLAFTRQGPAGPLGGVEERGQLAPHDIVQQRHRGGHLKTIVATRMKRPGARWKEDGAQPILALRTLATSTSRRWEAAMAELLASYGAHVTPLPEAA